MAKVDYFLKLDGIEGGSIDDKHKGELEILSFSWGATNSGTFSEGPGGGAGKAAFQDFHITSHIDKSYPKLKLAVSSGQHIAKATFTARRAGTQQQEYLKIEFSELLVSSIQLGGGGEIVPTMQISLNFAKFEVEHKEQKADGTLAGSVKAGWHLPLNKKV